MIITIAQNEIEYAIQNYLASKIKLNDNQEFKVELAATRGPSGITANIEIKEKNNQTNSEPTPKVTTEKALPVEENAESAKEVLFGEKLPEESNNKSIFSGSNQEKPKNPFAGIC